MASVIGRRWREMGKRIAGSMVCLVLLFGLLGCSGQSSSKPKSDNPLKGVFTQETNLEEVAAPEMIQQLRRSQFRQSPQVKILGLKPGSTIEQTTVNIRFEVEDFPIFKDPELNLGPHLKVWLDDRPYTDIYDAKQSITFTDLKPGTHWVQVFASTPWEESFKATDAFDQLSFNVFAPTQTAPEEPRLLYSQPQGDYGSEPILLDYILTHSASSQLSALPNPKVQVTVNGKSFVTEELPPIYLKGFKAGTNWVKVEVLDSNGKASTNPLNETIQVVTLKPGGKDSLSKLKSGELSAKDAEQIVSLEASQRQAAQRLESLAAPKPSPSPTTPVPITPAPTPKAIEKKAEEKVDVVAPIKLAPVSLPSKAPVPPSVIAVPQKTERTVTIPVKKEPEIRSEPIATPSPTATVAKPPSVKPLSAKDDAVQSFLKRFRPSGAVKPVEQSPSPSPLTQVTIPSSDAGVSSKVEVGARPSPSISPAPSIPTPSVRKTSEPPTNAPSKVVNPVSTVSKPGVPLVTEKAETKPSSESETFPVIAWKKFLDFKAGMNPNSSSPILPDAPKAVPQLQTSSGESKTEPLKASPSPVPEVEPVTSKL